MNPIVATLDSDPSGLNLCPGAARAAQIALCGRPPGVASMMRLVATAKLLTILLDCAGLGRIPLFRPGCCPRSSGTVATVRSPKGIHSSTHEMPCFPFPGMRMFSSVVNSFSPWMKLWCGQLVVRPVVSAS